MEIENIPISEIIPYERNPRKNEKAVEIVAKSIKEFGFQNPIIVDKNNEIIAGHTRLKAALKLKMTSVPAIRAEKLTNEQVKAFRIMDNKSIEYSYWNIDLLKGELEDLKKVNYNLDLTGFSGAEIDWLLGLDDEERKKSKQAKYQISIGDIFQCGDHKVMCADATDQLAMDKIMSGEKIKLCITSPPYNMKGDLYEKYEDDLDSKAYIELNIKAVKNLIRHLEGYIFWNLSYNVNSRWEFIEIFHQIITQTDLKFLENIIWDKGHGMPIHSQKALTRQYENVLVAGLGETMQKEISYSFLGSNVDKVVFNKQGQKALTNYWRIDTKKTQTEEHRAAFPIELPTKAIRILTNEGDIVLDCFGGTGTTLIAAENTKRKARIIELDPWYCSFIIERWEENTSKTTKKL